MPKQNKIILKLTQKQYYRLDYLAGTRTSIDLIIKEIIAWGIDITQYDTSNKDFIKKILGQHRKDYYISCQKGEIVGKFTPHEIANKDDAVVINPIIGRVYRLRWAYKGARFKLVKIDGDIVYLDNTVNKRVELLKSLASDLRLPPHTHKGRVAEITNI